ncbi:hypothetical protein EI77_04286 [Prosthecobacter fusiformis]|uniref:Uncharacterized protein n=1 Tax=Prosthecobacter fusiformis TaxID=48464 RepID=A0A4R7RKN8_9BACT|nr:hypothetical protein [Prosthecobacter fusiformis]TDU64102.1 hypothetical protein EI77_04286 [Prosthecobacter fusiformis]
MHAASSPTHRCLEALEPRIAPAGIVAVTFKGGHLTLSGDGEANLVAIEGGGSGLWFISDPVSGTQFKLNGEEATSELYLPVTGNLKVNLQGGDDNLQLFNLRIGGSVTLKDSEGRESISMLGNEVNGAVHLDTGMGDDIIQLGTSSYGELANQFNSSLTIKTGSGSDNVTVARGSYRNISADLGTGSDNFALSDEYYHGAIYVLGNVTIIGRGETDGASSIALGSETFLVTGNVKAQLGTGTGQLELNRLGQSGRSTINGNFSYQGATGSDNIYLRDNITVGGKLDLKMGKGDSQFDGDSRLDLTAGSLNYTAGTGTNYGGLDGITFTIVKDAVFNMASTTDSMFSISMEDAITVGGGLSYKGGKGGNEFSIVSEVVDIHGRLQFSSTRSMNNGFTLDADSALIGSFYYYGSRGGDILNIGDFYSQTTLGIQILGKTYLAMGSYESNELRVTDTIFRGSVSIYSGTTKGEDYERTEIVQMIDSAFQDYLYISQSGTQNSNVYLHNNTYFKTTSIYTGRGNDTVIMGNMTENLGNTHRSNLFYGAVKIILGAGNDTVILGSNDDGLIQVGNVFNSSVYLYGGSGTEDTAVYQTSFTNKFNGRLTARAFDIIN